MCVRTTIMPILNIAKEDIVVYKKVHIQHKTFLGIRTKMQKFISDQEGFVYKPNKVYKTTLDYFTKSNIFPQHYVSKRGFYSWSNRYGANVKCIIPKGSKYYLELDRNTHRPVYISDKIKIVSKI